MTADPVAVVIPLYRNHLTRFEEVSLEQCHRVLGRHPRIVIAPQSLDVDALPGRRFVDAVERFPDEYFRSVAAYSRLMLEPALYERFARFGHILIYQLDAFVFRDELLDWCARGYDYIGAPWVHRSSLGGPLRRARYGVLAALAAWTGSRRESDELLVSYVNRVGNGGFSLRSPRALAAVLRDPPAALARYREPSSKHDNEDVFWSLEVNRYRRRLRIPGWREALDFAFEGYPAHWYERRGGRLPFGCHGWDKHLPEFWLPLIRSHGYAV